MGKVKSQGSCQKSRLWLKSSKISDKYAFCMACKKNVDITAGICQVQNHEQRERYLNNIN